MISISNMKLVTREVLLDNFSYNFLENNIYIIIAENGSGKTTFLRSVMGLLPINSGIVEWNKKPIQTNLNKLFYFESNEWLDNSLSGLDYLKFIQKQWNSKISIQSEISFWGMQDYISLPVNKYSLGMKQKLIIAMYFISDANFLLMDEITNGLDKENRNKLYKRLQSHINSDKGIILTTHYYDEISNFTHKTLSLENNTMKEIQH